MGGLSFYNISHTIIFVKNDCMWDLSFYKTFFCEKWFKGWNIFTICA